MKTKREIKKQSRISMVNCYICLKTVESNYGSDENGIYHYHCMENRIKKLMKGIKR